jgi:protein subunit release factor B
MRERVLHITAKDCVRQTFRAGGKGGQNQNKRDTGVRFIHPPSGARGEARDERTQAANTRLAWRRMAESPEFQRWVRIEHSRAVGRLEAELDHALRAENLQIEYGPFA